ncbi:hypothetical protein V496_04484 [Pseudogymnoascus sp. VKM F-4515 (FW-2607)]|nr:hypothetical protein V496_04484 [Pseudogymnoascus sp. VKM F-4515 (FW-2607)]
MDQSPNNMEKSKVGQGTEAEKWEVDIIEKWNSQTETEKKKSRKLYRDLLYQLTMESNESLEKLLRSDLIELLDIAREEALTPPEENVAEQLNKARGKSFAAPSIKTQNMPFENLSKMSLAELLRVARVTPYYMLPKPEFLRVPNSDLVDLLREALDEYYKRYREPEYTNRVSRHVEREKTHRTHEAKLQGNNQVWKPKDTSIAPPSQAELELKGIKEMLDKMKVESDNRLDKVEGYGEFAVESDISTDSGTELTNATDSNSQNEKEGGRLRQARRQAVDDIRTTIKKLDKLYTVLALLEESVIWNKTLGIQDYDDFKMKAVGLGRELDDLISRAQEEVSLL